MTPGKNVSKYSDRSFVIHNMTLSFISNVMLMSGSGRVFTELRGQSCDEIFGNLVPSPPLDWGKGCSQVN